MTETDEYALVTNKSGKTDAYGPWTGASSEPVVKNKELDTWVPASEDTRISSKNDEEEESV